VRVYVIHMPNAERKAKIAAELARVGFDDITYIYAASPAKDFTMSNMRRNPRAEFGCALSHLKTLQAAYSFWVPDRDKDEVLIVEDDIVFADNAKSVIASAMVFLNDLWMNLDTPNWDLLYLGGHPRSPVSKVSDRLYKVGQFSCAEAYIVNLSSIPDLIGFWCDRAGQKDAMFDIILGEYAAQGGGYAFYPTLTHQPPGYSQIGQKFDDKTDLIRRGWESNLVA